MADNKYKLQFTLSNGETINAGEIVAPQGPKGDKGDSADIPYSSSTPFMDGVGSVGSANTVARGDHRHPSDTSRQEKLVSGTNIKTINGQSVLGSGDIPISGGAIDADTLNGLLSGSNGIVIAKNTAGDKVELKIPDSIFISNSLGTAKLSPQTISLFYNSENVGFLIDAIADGIYKTRGSEQQWYLHQGNVKTLFGNQQSIYGSGNIDLYRHIVWIRNESSGHQIYITVHIISSSNTPIDSLTDLFSVLNSYRNTWYPCNGRVNITGDKGIAYNFQPVSGGAVAFMRTDGVEKYYTWAQHTSGLTVEDTVTTI